MQFIPYGKQNIDQNDIEAVINTLTTGPKVKEFEDKICEFTGAVANGTYRFTRIMAIGY